MDRFGAFLSPVVGPVLDPAIQPGGRGLDLGLSVLAVCIAALGWFVADRMYRKRPESAAELAAKAPATYQLLVRKYFVDEVYSFTIVKPLLAFSKLILEWVVDVGILGGLAWLLGGIATLGGAILQRWQSGNLRSYAAWLALGAAALLLFVLMPWSTLLAEIGIHVGMVAH
jgi:NADH-quinone oxidoreductase subunit L